MIKITKARGTKHSYSVLFTKLFVLEIILAIYYYRLNIVDLNEKIMRIKN